MNTISLRTASNFGSPVRLIDRIRPHEEYKRKTFAPHGSFDIFSKSFTEDQIYEELEQLIQKRKKDKPDPEAPKVPPPKERHEATICYKPEDIQMRRAKENDYDPDADPTFEEDECAHYINQLKVSTFKAHHSDNRFDGTSTSAQPVEQIVNLAQEEDQFESDDLVEPPIKKVEQKAPNLNKNRNKIKEMKARMGR